MYALGFSDRKFHRLGQLADVHFNHPDQVGILGAFSNELGRKRPDGIELQYPDTLLALAQMLDYVKRRARGRAIRDQDTLGIINKARERV